jgi:E3 ubiquitin-protein ligase UBR3
MNLNVRQFEEHLQHDSPTYFSAFSAELEFCSSIMWSFIQHLTSGDDSTTNDELLNTSKSVIQALLNKLIQWLYNIGFLEFLNLNYQNNGTEITSNGIEMANFKHISFHLPLHRYFSIFIYNCIYLQKGRLDDIFSDNSFRLSIESLIRRPTVIEDTTNESMDTNQLDLFTKQNYKNMLINLMAHPLRLQVGVYEIHANMWVRNGTPMKGQAMTYVQNHFCTSFSDADLFLIQTIAIQLIKLEEANLFMKILFDRFYLKKWFKNCLNRYQNTPMIGPSKSNQMDEEEGEDREEEEESSELMVTARIIDVMVGSIVNNRYHDEENLKDLNHLNTMLTGVLTVLAQIVLIRPNLCLKMNDLTRIEIVNLLCVGDRTFSAIEDSLPDVCSLNSAKKDYEPILNDCADFLQPTLDTSSIGNVRQGRYKPKDSVWLKEYDPLYTMLRSVKKREFQESFDRYHQFVERQMNSIHKEKPKKHRKCPTKNLWPPFRIPNDENDKLDENIEKEMRQRSDILNTKTLHAFLLLILYEHNYNKQMPEKVIYFVVYIIELAIHFGEKKKTETKSTKSTPFTFNEFNYETWFNSDDILENISTTVPFTQLIKLSKNNDKKEDQQEESIFRFEMLQSSSPLMTTINEQQSEGCFKVPPSKKICSGICDTTKSKE